MYNNRLINALVKTYISLSLVDDDPSYPTIMYNFYYGDTSYALIEVRT